MNNSTKSLISYSIGIATGIAVGLLFAPEKGEIIRDRLTYRLGKYRKTLINLIDEIGERGEQVANVMENSDSAAKAEGQKVVNEAREKAESLLKDVEELMRQIKESQIA